MEFLHTYGVKVNSADAKGRTALHVAAANDDVDGVCRLMEWGADVNIKDGNRFWPFFGVKKKFLVSKKMGPKIGDQKLQIYRNFALNSVLFGLGILWTLKMGKRKGGQHGECWVEVGGK